MKTLGKIKNPKVEKSTNIHDWKVVIKIQYRKIKYRKVGKLKKFHR